MSGLALLINNSNEPVNSKISLPISDVGFKGFYCTTSYVDGAVTDQNKALRNYAQNQPNALKVGAPVIEQGYSRFKSNTNYLDTQIADSPDFTFFTIQRSLATQADNANRAFYIGPNNGAVVGGTAAAWGVGLIATATNGVTLQCGRGNNTSDQITGSVAFTGHDHSIWSLIWSRCNGFTTELHNVTQNLSATQSFALPRLLQQRTVKIGSGKDAYSGECDLFRAVWFDRALTNTEVDEMIKLLRLHATSRGITV